MSIKETPQRPPEVPRSRSSRYADAPSIYAALVLFGLTVGAVYLLFRLQYLLTILFLAVLVASGIAGPVRRLERLGVPRAVAILAIYVVLGGMLGGLIWYVLPPVLGQAASASADIPKRLRDLRELQGRVAELSIDYPIIETLEVRLIDIAANAGNAFTNWLIGLPEAVAKVLFTLVSVLTIALLLLVTKERLLDLILEMIHPRHRATTQRVLAEMGVRLGAYVRAKLIVIVVVASLVYGTLVVLGATYAFLVATFAGMMEALPRIGPWLGRIAIFLAVLPLGWRAVAIAMVAHVIIENLKGQVISPLIESDQVDIHPLTAFVAIIAGGVLLGWLGALIAVPVAAALQVVVQDVVIPWRRNRLASAESIYVAGPPLPESDEANGSNVIEAEVGAEPRHRGPFDRRNVVR
ncbi:MAG: AI-2E family transporter [Chloroflexia bacterium]|nr:AI-2E family transporter [Chloroflexia bacterium]